MKLKTANSSQAAQQGIHHGQIHWMKTDRKIQYNKRDTLNIYVKVIHSELTHRLHPILFDILDYNTRTKISSKIHIKYVAQKNKLKSLLNNARGKNQFIQKQSNHQFFNRFINLSNCNFSNQEHSLLNKGYNFNVQPKVNHKILESLGIDSQIALKTLKDSYPIKHQIVNILRKTRIQNPNNIHMNHYKLIKSIQTKTITKNLIFTKADKGNTIIVMNKPDYIQKTLEFITKGNFTILKQGPNVKIPINSQKHYKILPSIN